MDNIPLDVLAIGDSTIDTFIKIHDATIECDINHQECKICIRYGDKIPVDSIAQSVAGNAANVAVGVSTIGLKCAIYTNLGDDSQGALIKNTLTLKGVIADYIQIQKGAHSNLSVILTFQGERTAFVYHQPWFYSLPKLEPARWVYLTSLSQSFVDSSIIDEVAHYVDKYNSKLAFSPGTFQIKANIKRYPKTLEQCELIICNLEEAKQILEIDIKERVAAREVLDKMLSLGPKMIVVTDGEEGSYATDGNSYLKVGVFPTKLVEKTGAGDAYASAFIGALIYDMPMSEAMIWGTINASHVIRELGSQNGLLTKKDLERNRQAVSDLKAVSF
ncbi:hypothetical protein A3A49_01880 [Candidatus Curtissbacteria bacterium RIFCSPLOWO2_01_FULL_38_11b]|uniref:Carbohydrate kinase PfkB domain-containing protein n=1 Tax=Candidatus Curtissbacteria bacterium RIFCSPLOWO2_01_FULL_38_11b TaxID=1797725 RepID=A0A1F5H1S3_9BACT|nr:MAG: hypothetical protein A3A49_01880 [Candidatus Curtissbacteria bacterium RIFCSPLOWO2_01_FULL_38_11b]